MLFTDEKHHGEGGKQQFFVYQKHFYFVHETDAKAGGGDRSPQRRLFSNFLFIFDGRPREIEFDFFRYIFSDLII